MEAIISGIKVSGIASVLPYDVFEISNLASIWGEKKVKRIIRSTGVERIHVAKRDIATSDLCIKASNHLIEQLGVDKNTIDAVVFVSISPDYKAPATSVIIQDRLGLSKEVVAFDINYGCSAYIYGLYQAALLIKAGGCKKVLLCTGDIQSRIINKNDKSLKTILGDAAAATLVEEGDDVLNFTFQTDGSRYDALIIPAGGVRTPYSDETKLVVVDEEGNERSQNDLYMDGMEVMRFALTDVPKIVNRTLELAGLKKDDINIFAFHQPNKLILEHIKGQLELNEANMPIALSDTGNTASASIPLLLCERCSGIEDAKLAKVLACGFGIGLSAGAVTLNLSKTKILRTILFE